MNFEEYMKTNKKIEGGETEKEKTTFELNDSVLEKYIKRAKDANSEENIESISVESDDGKNMMEMIEEFEGFSEEIKDSDLKYSIDGAIGLSLRQLEETNSFLRKHRDIDLIVLEDEIEKLNETLSSSEGENKWGLFVWHTEDTDSGKGMSFSKFNPSSFKGKEMLVVMPVSGNGNHDTERYEGLTLIDVHYLKKDGEKYNYNRLPVDLDDIFSNEKVNLPNGEEVPVVNLVHMAIGKAKSPRKQDNSDLNYILENITDSQKEEIRTELAELLENTDNETEKGQISLAIEKII